MKAGSLYPFLLINLDGPNLSIIHFATKHVAFYPDLPTFSSFFLASWMPGRRRNLDSANWRDLLIRQGNRKYKIFKIPFVTAKLGLTTQHPLKLLRQFKTT
jgi:hypothetical protein